MKKLFITLGALVALAVPSAAMAAAPTGEQVLKPTHAAGTNMIGYYSSFQIQNGQFVSADAAGVAGDWTHQQGDRADQVQSYLALTGLGNGK